MQLTFSYHDIGDQYNHINGRPFYMIFPKNKHFSFCGQIANSVQESTVDQLHSELFHNTILDFF